MLEHLVVYPKGGLCNRLRAIASARRLAALHHARCSLVWEWGDYAALFADDTEWIASAGPPGVQPADILPDYHHIRHLDLAEGGNADNRRVPVTTFERVVVTSRYVFFAAEEPVQQGYERAVLAWFPKPQPAILAIAAEFKRAHFPPKTVGLHMRRSDHRQARLQSPDEAYWRAADRLAAQGYSLFLATDTAETLRAMQARYGDRLLHYPKASPLEKRWPRPTVEMVDLIDDLVDLWLLAACDFVIGSALSSYSRVAILLNGSPHCQAIDLARRNWLARLLRF